MTNNSGQSGTAAAATKYHQGVVSLAEDLGSLPKICARRFNWATCACVMRVS